MRCSAIDAGRDTELDVEWRSSAHAVPEQLWREALPPPREGLFWHDAIENGTLPAQFSFRYGFLTRAGRPIGVVPAFLFDVPLDLVLPPALARWILPIARGPLRGLASQRTLFLGNVAGEENSVGLVPGEPLEDVAAFVHQRARTLADSLGAPMVVWKDVPEEMRPALDVALARTRAFRMPSFPGSFVEVVPGGFDAFLAKAPSSRRYKIRAKLRKGKAAVPTFASAEARPSEAALDAMFALFEQTRARAKTRFETITRAFFSRVADAGCATFVALKAEGTDRIVAFMLLLGLGSRVVNQFIGLDYACAEAGHLYFQLHEAAYDWAAGTGAHVMCSGQTGYTAKLDLGHRLVPLWNYAEHRHRLVNAAFRRGSERIGWQTLDAQLAPHLAAHPDALPPR